MNESVAYLPTVATPSTTAATIIYSTTLNNQATVPCYLVNNIKLSEQCKFMEENNCLESDATFDYVYLVYCDFGHDLRYASILLLALLVIVLFLALSSVADEFLCPSLLSVARNLRMSDSLAVSYCMMI